MDANTIQKYQKYTTPQLRLKAGKKFRKFIRKRDEDGFCISCGSSNANQAGHYYSAGHYPELEFHENNVHLQCVRCNMHIHGNLIEYQKRLVSKIGQRGVDELDYIVSLHRRIGYKHDRIRLIEIILKYD